MQMKHTEFLNCLFFLHLNGSNLDGNPLNRGVIRPKDAHSPLIHSHEPANGRLCRCDGVMDSAITADGLLFSC